jgi:tRNA(Arg) A34 adenosine deaminase TadA
MCAGAILQARIDTVVWGAPNKLLGADGSWIRYAVNTLLCIVHNYIFMINNQTCFAGFFPMEEKMSQKLAIYLLHQFTHFIRK